MRLVFDAHKQLLNTFTAGAALPGRDDIHDPLLDRPRLVLPAPNPTGFI